VKNLVTEEEIAQVAKLMKIEIEDHSEHVEKVQKMLQYFDILDKANVESEKLENPGIKLDKLRNDRYISYDKKLLKFLKIYKEKYVKAPKLS
jgi:aspartyl-tRNA(Asn)/glutamyl-tRNA(Gln) amidotransferase subunit C